MAGATYQRLPGRGARRGKGFAVSATRNSLWLGEDHILSVDSNISSETYKRFYYRDIQAIILQRTSRRAVRNLFFTGLGLLSAQLFWIGEDAATGWAVILLACWLICLLYNTIRGPTCICRLKTAVQEEELAALRRVRAAHWALALIGERVTAVQARPTPAEIAGRYQPRPGPELEASGSGAAEAVAPAVEPQGEPPVGA